MNNVVKMWTEAARPRTLPVSVAGVAGGCAAAWACGEQWRLWPMLLCMIFALLAQIASNFANEYFDYKDGIDSPGRVGPRRGVTEGDITPRAMAMAAGITLALACCVGLPLIIWGGWPMIAVGVCVAVGVLAYSAGPWPLSRHGLGEVAVVLFFGVVPVNLTFYLATGVTFWWPAFMVSVGIGLMGANVLIVNNYRDYDDDRAVGKRTLAVILGRNVMPWLYLINGIAGVAFTLPLWLAVGTFALPMACGFAVVEVLMWRRLLSVSGGALNPFLGLTARALVLFAAVMAIISGFSAY